VKIIFKGELLMKKWDVINRITETGLVVVVRGDNPDIAKRVTDACLKGGATAIEITYTVPGASQVIEELVKSYSPSEMIIGAGTVLDSETARIAILSGAQYVVSPHLNLDLIKLCNRYQVPCMPGVMTVEGAVEAMEAGADILKLFPCEVFGPKMIKAIKGPLPQANIMPTGHGINIDSVTEWIEAGAVAVGTGNNITAGAKTGDFESITKLASRFLNKIKEARG
jgi:2-dehydro-3-deoxyphosphogluconate aldolase/(4S)-4-hydroxy-2-oxoglutarate aldolase